MPIRIAPPPCILAALLALASPAAEPPCGARAPNRCQPALERYHASQPLMGSSFAITLYAPDQPTADRALAAAFARIAALNAIFSDYEASSEASRLSQAAPMDHGMPVSPELWTLLERSLALSRQSRGAFDVTVGPLTRLWRRARRQHRLPDADLLAAARAATGYQHVRLDPQAHTVQLLVPGMRLDFGAIAKGYAADEALASLRAAGLDRALVNASGNVALGAPPPGETGWRIGLAPLDPRQPPTQFLRVAHGAIATSGDAYQFVEIAGRRYSHIVDPRTGVGLATRCSVTVWAPDATTADGLATAVCVLGPTDGLRLVEGTHGTAARIVWLENDEPQTRQSAGFPASE